MGNQYYIQQNDIETERLKNILADLPPFISVYFNSISLKQIRTRVGYARDIDMFMKYLHNHNSILNKKTIKQITLEDIEKLTPDDMEEYRTYLQHYKNEQGEIIENQKNSLSRKMSALNGLFEYLVKRDKIVKNPMRGVEYPKIKDKPIVKLNQDEIYELIHLVNSGDKLTKRQLKFHDITVVRDVAIITLFLGTGLRISELVGLDVDDINFENNSIIVTRKGGDRQRVYFGEEVADALATYLFDNIPDDHSDNPLTYRDNLFPYEVDSNEKALFLSLRGNRMAIRSVQTMVKKYTQLIGRDNISAHKLRSSYGSALYNATGDIYLVADVLGHKDVNVTTKHYAAIQEQHRMSAVDKVSINPKQNT